MAKANESRDWKIYADFAQILINKAQMLYADEDLNLASCALGLGAQSPYRLIAYHAQQCAEKYPKAFLVYHKVDFAYTHSIRVLLKLRSNLATWSPTLKDAEELSFYAITARYPQEEQEVTEAEAKRAIDLARKVREQVRRAFKQLGIDLLQ